MPKKTTRFGRTKLKSRRVPYSTNGKAWRGTTPKKVRRKK